MCFRIMVFPDRSVLYGPGRIEIPQRHIVHAVGHGKILHHVFDHQLGPAIHIGRNGREIFLDRYFLRFAVYSRGGRENNMIHSCFMHGNQQMEGSFHVVKIILCRIRHGFANQGRRRKVNDPVNFMFRQYMFQKIHVVDVPGDQLHVVRHRSFMTGRQVVIYNRSKVFGGCQSPHGMGTDVAGSACN